MAGGGATDVAQVEQDVVGNIHRLDVERQRLLRTSQDGRRLEFRLAHPLYGDVLRASAPTLRVRSNAVRISPSSRSRPTNTG